MSIPSEEEAREFIAEVRENNGGITVEDRDFLTANRPSALRALQKTRRQLADSIKILVDNLYSKETRFLYELIQNAEDNSYNTATADGEKPFLAFKLYPKRIIVDSNEDGFSEDNIGAICSVGRSTKKNSAGYIGEKGIGFKSVFKIAHKVHIQSGPFSFAFSHTRDDDDDGLGMITPYYENAEELPKGVRTRMTLTLLDSMKFEELASEFRAVPDTFLMFLGRLQRLSLELYQSDNTLIAIQYSKRESKENGLYTTILVKTSRKDMEESTSEQKYYTTKRDLHSLPFDEARKDKQGNSIDRATVVLAFPVDEHDEPVLKQQYTYAFLPLRRVGFKFLIQADFVTQANREDVVHSERNQAVLKGVADAFVDAMVVFCKRPSLRYSWMRYLPEDSITAEFWSTLWTRVRSTLKQTPLLEPWSDQGLYRPSDLQMLSERFFAEDDTPLLPDIEGAEIYLSRMYMESDFQILKRLGTKNLHWTSFVDRLDADLRRSGGSKWRNLKNSADWRTRICKVLSGYFTQTWPDCHKRLRALTFIPLYDGRWVASAPATKIYFPKTAGIPIPADLGLDLVCPAAVDNAAWTDLLSYLDVVSCPQESVMGSIYRRYDAANFQNFEVSNGVAHIRYLYWFLPKDHSRLDSQVRLANQHGSLVKKGQYLYFPDQTDNYSPSSLFKPSSPFKQGDQLPGHPVHYLHQSYLKSVSPDTIRLGRPWMKWLEEIVGIRRVPELLAEGHGGLSREFQYIVNHRSDRLLGTLKRGWDSYHSKMIDVAEDLRERAVLLENGRRLPLGRTFLPFPRLKQVAAELHIAAEFPFIAISELLRDEDRFKWMFVKDLQVGIEEDLDFYLSALESLKATNPVPSSQSTGERLTRIYRVIQSKCSDYLDHVRDKFAQSVIWIPASIRNDSSWLSTAGCVWDGPPWLKSKQRLKCEVYLELEPLFKVSLDIPDASKVDVINDLLMLKSRGGDEIIVKSQPAADTQRNRGTISVPHQVTSIKDSGDFQSITAMRAYEKHSFEELRLEDYDIGGKLLSTNTSNLGSKAFAGIEIDQIVEEAEKRYQYLWQKHTLLTDNDELGSWKALQFTFENSALIYIPKKNVWYPPSQCVWVDSNVKIPGKASLADAYPSLEKFFTDILNISKPTVEMYVESMKAEAKGKASAARIKETMKLICSLGVGERNFSSLVEAKILPVKLTNGADRFTSASSKGAYPDFAIMESSIHRDAFDGKVVVLDFSLGEIRDTRPFLLAMGLKDRFSSKLVKEVTDVRGGSKDSGMTNNLRSKSQAIVRCAFHFASLDKRQDVNSLYQKFKRAIVHVSDGIRRSLQIIHGGRVIESASSRADFHFEEIEHALQLYLPKDEVERDVCFESDLPRRLCTFLGITDPSAPAVVGSVFRKDNPIVIDRILEKAGVSQVDFDFTALDEHSGATNAESEVGSDVETLVNVTDNVRSSIPISDPGSYTPHDRSTWRERHSGSEHSEYVRDEVMSSSSDQERQREAHEAAYKRILEHVVKVARQRANSGVFESTGSFTENPVATGALTWEISRNIFATRTQERDFNVGVAGELYMFELLKGLGLPGFNLDNWKSEIRDRVKIHEDYQDLKKYHGPCGIADIEYLDGSGTLTRFLKQKGHLAQGWWDKKGPLYHIEVKTTTSTNWQEPFFMSKFQERHIYHMRLGDGKNDSNIYMICRIFNLGKGDQIGMHVYLDPETKRRNNDLEFSTHTWAVKPLTHPIMRVENTTAGTSAARTSGTGGTTAKESRDTGIDDVRKELGVPTSPPADSSKRNSVPQSSNWTFGSSNLQSRNGTESRGEASFNFNSPPSIDNTSTPPPSNDNISGIPRTELKPGKASTSTSIFPNKHTFRSPPVSFFDSSAPSSNSSGSKATQTGSSIFDSNSMSNIDLTPKPSSIGPMFGMTASSDATKGKPPSATRSPIVDFRTSATAFEVPTRKDRAKWIYKSPGGNSLNTADASSLFSSSHRGSIFGTVAQPRSSITKGSIFGIATQPSSSTATDSIFGTRTTTSPSPNSRNPTVDTYLQNLSSTLRDPSPSIISDPTSSTETTVHTTKPTTSRMPNFTIWFPDTATLHNPSQPASLPKREARESSPKSEMAGAKGQALKRRRVFQGSRFRPFPDE